MQSNDMDHPPSKRRRINMDSLATQQSSSPSSSFSSHSWTYDVFLSFRGEDTRYDFTDHLHKNLVEEGIRTFRDDKLPRGEEISQALVQAIQGSKSSLIVFSENYASSKWCLDELVHILECKTSSRQQKVWPVFYKVDPSDVRNQRGSFGAAFAKHESNLKGNMERVMRWKAALLEAGKLSGWHFPGSMYESKFIDGIVKEISAQVKEPTPLDVPKWLVGLDSRVQDMRDCLDVGGSDIRLVGIWGTGGIGKTTIAKVVYNSIAHNFERSCFLENVREESEVYGRLLNLQNNLLSNILGHTKLEANNVDTGITLLRETLRHKRILLVLDDVNKLRQLESLAGASNWFGRGSRIIITTRDRHLLCIHDVNLIYTAKELDPHEARELFSSKAFKNKTDLDDDEKLAVSSVVEYAQGLPLALVVLGSSLCCTSIHKWQAILDGYKRSHFQDIQNILKINYDALENPEKEVFLDIACFFKNQNKNYVIQILKGCGHINPEHDIKVLEEKALINVEYGTICLHDLLEEMGKGIVHQESPNKPGKRSRLWFHEDVHNVLTKNTGTSEIEGIIVKMPTPEEIHLSPKCFKKMQNLKIFINVNARFCGKLDYLPETLSLVDWPKYPFQSLPSKFNMKKLVELNMPCSQISRLGKGFKPSLNLKSINFTGCEFLTKIPDLSGCPNLETMDLFGCKSLVEVHCSVGSLEKLVDLDLGYCKNLVKLPRKVNWRCLQHFNLAFCEKLKSLPEIVGEMKYLTRLYLYHCYAIKELPSSIRYIINLEKLFVAYCENLTNLPCSIYQLQKLEEISLFSCQKLTTFPNKVNSILLMPTGSKVSHGNSHDGEGCSSFWQLPGDREFNFGLPSLREFKVTSLSDSDFLTSVDCASTLNKLDLSGSNIVSLSECLRKFICVRELHLGGCRNLVDIPQLPPCIELLVVWDCISLERISKLSKILEREESQMIEEMNLSNCCRLIENLVKEVNVLVNDDYQAADALFALFLSCQQSKFTVEFPGSKMPKWFSCQMEFKWLCRFEFVIEILANFKWENTGLALCFLKQYEIYSCYVDVSIDINEVNVLDVPNQYVHSSGSDHVWLHYIPFLEMGGVGYMRPLPPFMCRVIFYTHYRDFDDKPYENEESALVKSCGVHLVMPPNEDVCMKLSGISEDIYKYDDDEDDEDDEDDDEDDDDEDDDDDDDDEDDEDDDDDV